VVSKVKKFEIISTAHAARVLRAPGHWSRCVWAQASYLKHQNRRAVERRELGQGALQEGHSLRRYWIRLSPNRFSNHSWNDHRVNRRKIETNMAIRAKHPKRLHV
jgi:hypothetical protein